MNIERTNRMKLKPFLPLLALLASALSSHAAPLGTAFTYQGKLTDEGQPANGAYDLLFALTSADAPGAQVGGTLTNDSVWVTNGLFTTQLDFGQAAFSGAARWLDIAVRRTAGTNLLFTALSPRQPLTATPHALHARSAESANNAGSAASVAWGGISGKPASLADNVDNDTQYAAGTGLNLTGTNFSVNFGGTGSSILAAHSDHKHFGNYWVQNSTAFGLGINNSASNGLGFLARQGGGSGSGYSSPGLTAGLWGDSSDGRGVIGTSKDDIGVLGRATAASGLNYGVMGTTDSPAGYGGYAVGHGAGGVAIKAGGSGIIQSTAKSYVFFPGAAFHNANSARTLRHYTSSTGQYFSSGGVIEEKTIVCPLTLPGVLYGQPVTVKNVTVYYACQDSTTAFINSTVLAKVTGAASAESLIFDATDRTSNTASSYTLAVTGGGTLSASPCFLYLTLGLTFGDAFDSLNLAGVRVELEHQ